MENSDCSGIGIENGSDSDWEDFTYEDKDRLLALTTSGLPHVPSAPLYEVFSVKIFPNSFALRKTCEVYGQIHIIDEYGNRYQLYSREPNDPELISRTHNSLSVYLTDDTANNCCNWSNLSCQLKDRIDEACIIDGVFPLDSFTESDYDKVKSHRVDGAAGYAFVKYTKFFAAVQVYLGFTIVRNEESEKTDRVLDDKSKLYGTIVARYGNTCGAKFPGIVLFEKPSDLPFALDSSETCVPLLRHDVIVPAYSFFRLDVNFYDSQSCEPLVNSKVEFLTTFRRPFVRYIETKDFLITVNAGWVHPDQMEKPIQPGKAVLRREPADRTHSGCTLTEVFAFVIGHNDDSVLKVCGEMAVADANSIRHAAFTRDESNPEILSSNRTIIPIEGPSECYAGADGLTMFLNLRDVEGRALIKGNYGWNRGSLEWPISWYNRRICSISAGVNGYAAVFYQMFRSGVQAIVNVSLLGHTFPNGMPKVYGSIFAKYSNEEYSTEYEKSYYRSVLFDVSRENSVELTSSLKIPLRKSLVAVPMVASLILELDLHIYSEDYPEESLRGEGMFDFEGIVSGPAILGVNFNVRSSVAWGGYLKKCPVN